MAHNALSDWTQAEYEAILGVYTDDVRLGYDLLDEPEARRD